MGTLTFDLKFSEMLNTALRSLFDGPKFLPGTFEWSYDSQPVILPILGHVVI